MKYTKFKIISKELNVFNCIYNMMFRMIPTEINYFQLKNILKPIMNLVLKYLLRSMLIMFKDCKLNLI